MSSSSPGQDSHAHVSCQTCPEALYNRNTSFSHAQESSVKTGTKWKTTIEVKDEESTSSGHFQPHQEQKRTEPFSSLWILSRLRDLATEAGIGTLKQWVHTWPETTRGEQRPHSTTTKHPHQRSFRLVRRSPRTQMIRIQSQEENRSGVKPTDQTPRSREGNYISDTSASW